MTKCQLAFRDLAKGLWTLLDFISRQAISHFLVFPLTMDSRQPLSSPSYQDDDSTWLLPVE